MSKIKIRTITNVHVGSGEMLYLNNDFCIAKDSDGHDVVGIIDPRKVMELIGVEHIGTWVLGIERKRPVEEIVRQYAPKAMVEDYSSRVIKLSSTKTTETLKECIHDGLGRPFIPGSSIKGAIRTAVLASATAGMRPEHLNVLNGKGMPDASMMEKRLFGSDPNSDVFRFLHVGDAIFGELPTSAITMVNINEREKHSFWDTSKGQTIEALRIDDKTTFNLRIKLDAYRKCNGVVGELPYCMSSVPVLFDTINAHTFSLLKSEIDYWAELKDADETHKIDAYIDECKKIKIEAEECESGKSCILRIGHGCGWRFITGAWTERSPLFSEKIVPAARPSSWKYTDYDFPKSRRVAAKDCSLLGFVKLTIEKE